MSPPKRSTWSPGASFDRDLNGEPAAPCLVFGYFAGTTIRYGPCTACAKEHTIPIPDNCAVLDEIVVKPKCGAPAIRVVVVGVKVP